MTHPPVLASPEEETQMNFYFQEKQQFEQGLKETIEQYQNDTQEASAQTPSKQTHFPTPFSRSCSSCVTEGS